jgi:polysaccharide pyruvyl transferase WcaK-like protein
VLQVATQKIIKDRYNGDIVFVPIHNQQTYFFPQLIEKMNKEADLLLVGGGGFIMHRPEDKSRSGWQFNIETKDIKKIDIPIAVYGIGYNRFPHDPHAFGEPMWENLQEVINKSSVFSVRNQGTYDTMLDEGRIDVSSVEIVPDAGMFMPSETYSHQCLQNKCIKIGINWATDRQSFRFGSEEESAKQMSLFFHSIKRVADNYNAKIYLIEHLLKDQRNKDTKEKMHESFTATVKESGVILYNEILEDLYPPFDYKACFFADIYKQMDCIIGMRGHANIISFGQNTPCVGLGQHNKVKWFLEQIGLENLHIPLNGKEGEIIKGIEEKVKDVIENKEEYKEKMIIGYSQLSYIKDAFVDKIVKLL